MQTIPLPPRRQQFLSESQPQQSVIILLSLLSLMRVPYRTPQKKNIIQFGQKEKNCLPPQIIHL